MIQSLLARAGRLYAQFLRELPKAMRQRSIKDYRWWPGCAHRLITWCGRAAGDHWMNSDNSGQHTGHYLPVMIAPFYRPQPERGSAIFSGQNGNHKSVPTATAQTFLLSRRCSDCLFGAAIAQQLDRIWRIGILHGVPAEASVGVSAFRQRFGELG